MSGFVRKLAGTVLIAGAVIGFLFNVAGLVALWTSKENVTQQLTDDVSLISRSLRVTTDGLDVVAGSIKNARDNLSVVMHSLNDLAVTIDQTNTPMQQTATLLGYELPRIIDNARSSLTTASKSAKVVDDTLRVISAIPFIGARYKPDVPLQNTIEDVSNSLQYLPDSFVRIQKGVQTAGDNLQTVKTNIYELSGELNTFDISLQDAQSVVQRYQDIFTPLAQKADQAEKSLPGTLNWIYLIATVFLVWLLLVQVVMLFQGLELLNTSS